MQDDTSRTKDKQYYIDLIENKYEANVDRYHLEGVLACFLEDAVYTVQTANRTYVGRDTEIRAIFANLFKNYPSKMVHKDFHHVIDLENECIASRYTAEYATEDGQEFSSSNCSFFYFESGKFKRIVNYMSASNNPLAL